MLFSPTSPGMYSLPSRARAQLTPPSSLDTSSAAQAGEAGQGEGSGQRQSQGGVGRSRKQLACCPPTHIPQCAAPGQRPALPVKVGLSTYWMSASDLSCTSYMSGRQYTRPLSTCRHTVPQRQAGSELGGHGVGATRRPAPAGTARQNGSAPLPHHTCLPQHTHSTHTFMNMWCPASSACVYACVLGPRPCTPERERRVTQQRRKQGCTATFVT